MNRSKRQGLASPGCTVLVLMMMGTSSSQSGEERKEGNERRGAHVGDTKIVLQKCMEGRRTMGNLWGKCGEADEEAKKKEHVYIVTELIRRVECNNGVRDPVSGYGSRRSGG